MSPAGSLSGLPPGVLPLLRYGIPVTLSVVLPFLGIVIVGTAFSLVLNVSGREHGDQRTVRLSRDLIEAVTIRSALLFVAGLLPLPLVVLGRRLFAPSVPLSGTAWIPAFTALLAGCALVSAYRRAARRSTNLGPVELLAGAAGLLALLSGVFLLVLLPGTLLNPSKVPLILHSPVYFVSWNAVAVFLLILAMSCGLTGGVVLLAVDRSRKGNQDPGYREYVRSVGSSLARGFAPVIPVLVLLDLVGIPETGLSVAVFVAEAAILLLAPAVFLLLSPSAGRRPEGRGAAVTILYVLMFFALVAGRQEAGGNAVFRRPLPFLVPEAAALVSDGRVAAVPATTEEMLQAGERVFETICAVCHRFDSRLVGPPFDEVLPRYRGDAERLKDFVRDPVKVNAGYPEMPKVGVTERQLDDVARYLLHRLGQADSEVLADATGTAEQGEEVFRESCRSCHLFDLKVVGPALDEVVPKYRGEVEQLKNFIREPVKVDPAFPHMPTLPLNEKKIDAVARYLLERSGESGKSPDTEKKPDGLGGGH